MFYLLIEPGLRFLLVSISNFLSDSQKRKHISPNIEPSILETNRFELFPVMVHVKTT